MNRSFRLDYLICVLAALICTSCATSPTGTTQQAQRYDLNAEGIDEHKWPEQAREVLFNALSLTGINYKYGGSSPETGFDCSGFVRYVYLQSSNLTLPHSARAMSQLGKSIPKNEMQPGDLVFFNTLRSAFSHVGIYLGNNRFIHAPSTGGNVRIENMQNNYWEKHFNGAQRIETASKGN